jgi:hypothetical protein
LTAPKTNNYAPHKPVQIKNSNIPLSKEQQAFNRLSKRIENCKNRYQTKLMHSHKTQVAVTQFIKDFYIDPKETFFMNYEGF